ncbi:hypothetical protein GCM10009414_20970 [Tatumella terrea]|uniref:phage protein NinX family protein n=1 Tax=Tatumella TaxID=82986 RepID=UPI001BB03DF5|nr:DUF2591 family protein [Tatumella sp. JGM118]
MNYSKLTDGEISVLVGRIENPKCRVELGELNPKSASIFKGFGRVVHKLSFCPCSRAEDGFRIILRERISLTPHGKASWMAAHESGVSASNRNPLRAAMIVFLMMKESGNG